VASLTTTTRPILTVGHGTLAAGEFGQLLAGAAVDAVADVRRYPGSRRHPHFASAEMAAWLGAGGVDYVAIPSLGGRRRPSPDTLNVAWRNKQFQAYADHMATGEFGGGVQTLLELAATRQGHVAVLCSESVWWRCHRRLLADHLLLVAGVDVRHLFHDGRINRHSPTTEAVVAGDHVEYPEP